MGFSKFEKDMNIISVLDDSPALSSSELKAKFDEAGRYIKEYINETLLKEIESNKQNSVIICSNEPSGGVNGDIILVYKG